MRFVTTLLLATTALAVPFSAEAADYAGRATPMVVNDPAPLPEEEIGSGWYLRGDLGYGLGAKPDYTVGNYKFDNPTANGQFTFGGGFGYKFSDYFRADVTIDRIQNYNIDGKASGAACFTNDTCSRSWHLGGSLTPMMANAYIDLPKWQNVTPYVGGGVGLTWSQVSAQVRYVNSFGGTTSSNYETKERWTPTVAAMAGFAYDLGEGIQIDAGYRYLWMESISGTAQMYNSVIAAETGSVTAKNQSFHQFRLGARFFLN